MILQQITFTPDEEEEACRTLFSGFSPILPSFQSPKRPTENCFSSSDFDWTVNLPPGPESTAQHFELSPKTKHSPSRLFLPSSIAIESNSPSTRHEDQTRPEPEQRLQPLAMKRDYDSSSNSTAVACDFDDDAIAVSNTKKKSNNTTKTISQQNTHEDDAKMYADLLQAQADFYASMVQRKPQQKVSERMVPPPPPPSLSNRMADNTASLDCFCDDHRAQGRGNLNVEQVQRQSGMNMDHQLGHLFKRDVSHFDVSNLNCYREGVGDIDENSKGATDPSATNLLQLHNTNNHQGEMQIEQELSGIEMNPQETLHFDFDQDQLYSGVINNGTKSDTIYPCIAPDHPTRLSITSDEQFLDPVNNFLRSSCIEVFVIDSNYQSSEGCGRGMKSNQLGQIGLRCVHCKHVHSSNRANQAVSFPSKTLNIFESVRNYQRFHFEACQYIPPELKQKYYELMSQNYRKIHTKYLKAYFAEAACELGMVEAAKRLFFGALPSTSKTPSEKLQAIMRVAKDPYAPDHQNLKDLVFPKVDERVMNSKFSHIASETTCRVIDNCRKETTVFVKPSDFPTLSDIRFVLLNQFIPCRANSSVLNRRKTKPIKLETLSGLCCKYCAKFYRQKYDRHEGMFFPINLKSLNDNRLFNKMTCHTLKCMHVPSEIKDALSELQRLTVEHGVPTKRGSRKRFSKKLWDRLTTDYQKEA